ncbi:DUF5602 domain-containing protein [Bdellovibrio svalbardensis]|uniref:DUF5602 domain-containing protein n=1 Tax=Bdellovibrio svalbardensis TaxID=2972972 RepID=A0ABT6DHH5_9BACT|nr:DUF5602 domain-containing protein [Bdellovibrio svalbardensis]MDG0816300.1 DUF5602 domain-containing protein [Bdellovibrio svalbardensis]
MKFFALVIGLSLFSALTYANTRYWGSGVAVGKGLFRTYIEVDRDKKPVSLGVSLTGGALDGLPDTEHEYAYVLSLPEAYKLPPYEHVLLNWNPHGHEPQEIYGAPHFDFHFYMMSNEDRMKITCTGDDEAPCMKQPAPDYLPQYYAPTPAGVPMMGWHWFDTRSPEFHGQPFTSTFIYGFYNGQVNFVEPMITREFLLNHGSVDADVPMPNKVAKSGYYPSRYMVSYDCVQDIISVEIRHFSQLEM